MKKFMIDDIRQTVKSKSFIITMIALSAMVFALYYFQPGVGYEIVSNGNHVGYVKTRQGADFAIKKIQDSIYAKKGKEAKFDANIEVIKGKIGDKEYTNDTMMQYNFEKSLDIRVPAYLIKKDNEYVMALKDEETANRVLEVTRSAFDKKTSKNISNVRSNFVQKVEVVKLDAISESKVITENEAVALINPSTSVSRSNNRKLSVGSAKKVNLLDVKTTYQEFSTKEVDFGIKKIEKSDMYVGESKLVSDGKKGVREVYSEITLVNGKQVSKKTLSQKVTVKPVDKVVYVGTKVKQVTTRGQVVLKGNPTGVARIALKYLGTPYVYGGTSPGGFDCSGFTQYVYRQAGVSLPRTSGAQSRSGQYVSLSNIQAGDLLYGPGHVGIYLGNGQFIHAPVPGQSVRIQPLSHFPRLSHGVRVIG